MTAQSVAKSASSGANASMPSYEDLAAAVLTLARQRDEARAALAQALACVSPGYARAALKDSR